MNVFKIAWRSIQHRGFGSWLTIFSMALGVMMVVAVLSIHGLVSKAFKSNNSFGYNVVVGARGGGLQLTLNSVYYLSQPVENVPYEYYLAFCNKETRQRELKHSIAWTAKELDAETRKVGSGSAPGIGGIAAALASKLGEHAFETQQLAAMEFNKAGLYNRYVDVAVPLCLGDFYVDPETDAAFRCIGTNPDFLNKLVLDIETEAKFEFAQGRAFEYQNDQNGFNECVIGSIVAKRCDLKLGDTIKPTHGDPNAAGAHIHENPFKVVGILKPTGTPNDRALFLNMEGFFLMDGHTNPLTQQRVLKTTQDDNPESNGKAKAEPDLFEDEAGESENEDKSTKATKSESADEKIAGMEESNPAPMELTPLPIEQRQVTSFLVRTSRNDPWNVLSLYLPAQINKEDDLESTLKWSAFRPERTQKSAQAVNPVEQVGGLFQLFVDPIRWLLLGLTSMICVVSALGILVGIYNSMSQRQHEIAVMRALGASRNKVMSIILWEAILIAMIGGCLGWFLGHSLNVAFSPIVESRTGVSVSFWDVAPGIEVSDLPGSEYLPNFLTKGPKGNRTISSELLIVPGLILLAIMVGVFPAMSAYRTDVSRALAK